MSKREAVRLALEVYDRAAGTDDEWIAYALLRAVAQRLWGQA